MTPAFAPETVVSIVVLSGEPSDPNEGRIVSVAGRTMTVATEISAAAGMAVQVEAPRYIVLAEVVKCDPGQTLTLDITHVLSVDEVAVIAKLWR
jgi:hypothetical protein